VGPPVYFVVNNTAGQLDLTKEQDQNKLCLGLPGTVATANACSQLLTLCNGISQFLSL
jgi:hypothetical protein